MGRDEAKVDRAVTEVIATLLSDPVSLNKLATPLTDSNATPDDDVEALQGRLDDAAAAYESGKLSLEMLARLEARILPRIKVAEERERERARDRFPAPVVAKVATAPDPRAVWKSLPLEGKREFLRATMRVVVHRVRSRWELGVEVHPIKTVDPQ